MQAGVATAPNDRRPSPWIYSCRPSSERDRPTIDFDLEDNAKIDWLRVGRILSGALPIDQFPSPVRVTVNNPDATTKWDCFKDGGTRGLFSRRFVDVVGREGLRDFSLLRATLNGADYVFLRCDRPTDCLDRQRSRYDTSPHDPVRIMDIEHFAFRDELLAASARFFCIPEIPDLLVTEEIARNILASSLKGVRLEPLP